MGDIKWLSMEVQKVELKVNYGECGIVGSSTLVKISFNHMLSYFYCQHHLFSLFFKLYKFMISFLQ
jgi:hypothetical protein